MGLGLIFWDLVVELIQHKIAFFVFAQSDFDQI